MISSSQTYLILSIALFATGCSTGEIAKKLGPFGVGTGAARNDTEIADSAAAAARALPRQAATISGRWLTMFHCHGNDYWLDTSLKLDSGKVDGNLMGTPSRAALPLTGGGGRAGPIDSRYSGHFDADTAVLRLVPASRHGAPALTALYSSARNRFVAKLDGRQWTGCSDAIILPPSARREISDQLPKAPSTTATLLQNSSIAKLYRQLAGRNGSGCDSEIVSWVEEYLRRVPVNLPRGDNGKAYVNAMYADKRFEAAFGSTLRALSIAEGRELSAQVMRVAACGLPTELAQKANQYVQSLALPLVNHAEHSRNEVAIGLAARPLYQDWLTESEVEVANWKNTPMKNAQTRLGTLGQLASPIAIARRGAWPADSTALEEQIEQTRLRLAELAEEHRLRHALASAAADMRSLQRLASYRPQGPAPERSSARVTARLDELLPAAGGALLSSATGLAGYQQLADWRGIFLPVAHMASPQVVATLQERIDERMATLASNSIAGFVGDYRRQVLRHPVGLSSLLAGNAYEKRISSEASPIAGLSQMRAFARERAARRALDLSKGSPELLTAASQQPHVSGLEALRDKYLLPTDRGTPAARALEEVIASRRQELAPFSHLDGGDYLNAIYAGDWKRARAMDSAFIEPYTRMLSPVLIPLAPLIDGIARMSGMEINTKAAMEKEVQAMSLIVPMFAVYLIDFEGRYPPECMGPDPVRFRVTRSSETVYRDGYGSYLYSVRHPDRIEDFRVNRRFAHVFKAVGLSNPDSTLGSLVDGMFGSKRRLNVSQIVRGTRKMMTDNACDSPLIRRMENSMLEFFAHYQERKRDVAEALLNRQ